MSKFIFFLIIFLFPLVGKSQLHILYADTSRYSNDKGYMIYPKLGLKTKQDSIYLNNNLVYVENKDTHIWHETFQNRYLLMSFNLPRGASVGHSFFRKGIDIIDLENPNIIYKAKLTGLRIVKKDLLKHLRDIKDETFYTILSINSEILTLIDNQGQKTEIVLERIKNPFIE